MSSKRYFFLIMILGAMTALSPFSIDMYLPAFQDIARSLNTTTSRVDLSLSSFFMGLAFGQLLYGPLMDKFGRKPPLYFGLSVYILASVGCFLSHSVDMLIAVRVVQALGSCAAGVASVAMVRDLFPVKDSAKVFALLVLVLGASPLVAPTIGGYLADAFGWQSVFIVLLSMAVLLLLAVIFTLPESFVPHPDYSLKPGPMMKNFGTVLRTPQFYTYALAGSLMFCGLFAYVSGSPLVFMDVFALTKTQYGWVFAGISIGFIGSSQLNSLLIKRFTSQQIIRFIFPAHLLISVIFLLGAYNGWFNMTGTIIMIFLMMCCVGLVNPNTAALSMAPFQQNAGVASSLLGTMQMVLGAAAAFCIGIFHSYSAVPMAMIMTCSSVLALLVYWVGRRQITVVAEGEAGMAMH